MSDTEDGPDGSEDPAESGEDGGFDKEAEREKLREQYEQDRQRREATQQMSELLLKGATMTNQHCDECGSPIFRYEGEAFCPTCAGTRDLAEGEAQQGGQVDGQQGDRVDQETGRGGQRGGADARQPESADAGDERPAPGDAARAASGDAGAGDAEGSADDELDDDELAAARSRLDDRVGSRSPASGRATDRRREPPVGGSPVRQGEVPSMAQTRASLRRAIVSLSEQAAQTDDPKRATDLLKGAREASEALAALEGTTGE